MFTLKNKDYWAGGGVYPFSILSIRRLAFRNAIMGFMTGCLIHCVADSWKECSVGGEPLCRINQSPVCSVHCINSGLQFQSRRFVCSPVGSQTSLFRGWHLLHYRYVMDHFSHPPLKWFIYYHLSWCYILDMGELFTAPECQYFLVTV